MVDKCFKLYGYSPGYGPKFRDNGKAAVNQSEVGKEVSLDESSTGYGSIFSQNESQRLIALLSSQLEQPQ